MIYVLINDQTIHDPNMIGTISIFIFFCKRKKKPITIEDFYYLYVVLEFLNSKRIIQSIFIYIVCSFYYKKLEIEFPLKSNYLKPATFSFIIYYLKMCPHDNMLLPCIIFPPYMCLIWNINFSFG